ncbi:DUF998 domain-containing protein [Micromonospora sp. HK10]|uniref:DUF998 domain-containing protein n=1 Tax=Micromonospora sp. HK10 TaxID=1538294 RepID=UPI0006272162|nr:DUF998 domain-containing protein [Micromonospora sp. HK10]
MTSSRAITSGRAGVVEVGAIFLVAAPVLLLLMNIWVEAAWFVAYSWASNNISDLGNVNCGLFDGREICSPRHAAFNIGMMAVGFLLGAGVVLAGSVWGRGGRATLARTGILLAAAGYVLVGIFPADVNLGMHLLAALLVMPVGNIAMFISGFMRGDAVMWRVRWVARALGAAAFVASYLHVAGPWLGIGKGGMERIAVFTLPVWLGGLGVCLLSTAWKSGTRWPVGRADRRQR